MTTNTKNQRIAYQGGSDRTVSGAYAIYAVYSADHEIKIASFPTHAQMLEAWYQVVDAKNTGRN